MSLKQKVEGNELDLSLNQLIEVPIKELIQIPKATILDLSCNSLQTLPLEFSSLIHLVKIDLSKNKLISLPDNFGNLRNLQSLDLYGNRLVTLPGSMCDLKNLKWLDLKNNPLDVTLKAVAGNCMDEKECQECAKKIVAYFQFVHSEEVKSLKVAKAKKAVEKAKINKELEEQRRLKKLEKEKRKADSKAKKEVIQQHFQEVKSEEGCKDEKTSKDRSDLCIETGQRAKGFNFLKLFIYIILTCVLSANVMFFVYLLLSIPKEDLKSTRQQVFEKVYSYFIHAFQIISSYIPVVKTIVLKNVHLWMINITEIAEQIEHIFYFYFY